MISINTATNFMNVVKIRYIHILPNCQYHELGTDFLKKGIITLSPIVKDQEKL